MKGWLLVIFLATVPYCWAQTIPGSVTQLSADPSPCVVGQVWFNNTSGSLKSCTLVNTTPTATPTATPLASAGQLAGAVEASNYATATSDWAQDICAATPAAELGNGTITYFGTPTSYTASATNAGNLFSISNCAYNLNIGQIYTWLTCHFLRECGAAVMIRASQTGVYWPSHLHRRSRTDGKFILDRSHIRIRRIFACAA